MATTPIAPNLGIADGMCIAWVWTCPYAKEYWHRRRRGLLRGCGRAGTQNDRLAGFFSVPARPSPRNRPCRRRCRDGADIDRCKGRRSGHACKNREFAPRPRRIDSTSDQDLCKSALATLHGGHLAWGSTSAQDLRHTRTRGCVRAHRHTPKRARATFAHTCAYQLRACGSKVSRQVACTCDRACLQARGYAS